MGAQKAQSVYQNITQLFSQTEEISLLKNQEILEIDILNSLAATNKEKIKDGAVVGTQSLVKVL